MDVGGDKKAEYNARRIRKKGVIAFKYEVRKDGKVYMSTTYEKYRYPPEVEASIQAAGYVIYIDGKRLAKIKPEKKARR